MASWIDAILVIQSKLPLLARRIIACLKGPPLPSGWALSEVQLVRDLLVSQGATETPSWDSVMVGSPPPQVDEDDGCDAGEWVRGWQYYFCSFSETFFLNTVVLPSCSPPRRALLLSGASGSGSAWLQAIPSEPCFTLSPIRFQVSIRRRLRWVLPSPVGVCGKKCFSIVDAWGDHLCSCMKSGKVKLRSRAVEKTWARISREAGGRVRENVKLRDCGIPGIDPSDGRNIEVVVTGLPLAHGIPIAIDASLVSPLHADGSPHDHVANQPGASLRRAERSKDDTYPELVNSSQLRLETVACEIGGRINGRANFILDVISAAKVRCDPAFRRKFMMRWWRHRWLSMLSISIQSCVAATLVDDGTILIDGFDGPVPKPSSLESREVHVDRSIQSTGHGMIAPPSEARGAMDTENPYPGGGWLNTLTHD